MDKKIKILMTGSGAPGWVPLYKCLKDTKLDLEIYGCDLFKQTAGAFYAKKHFKVPRGDDPNYINTLLDLVVKEKINIILPITDPELLPISKNINLFKRNGILIPISDYELIRGNIKLYISEKPMPRGNYTTILVVLSSLDNYLSIILHF